MYALPVFLPDLLEWMLCSAVIGGLPVFLPVSAYESIAADYPWNEMIAMVVPGAVWRGRRQTQVIPGPTEPNCTVTAQASP